MTFLDLDVSNVSAVLRFVFFPPVQETVGIKDGGLGHTVTFHLAFILTR